jgi:hypothetical protein
MGYKYRQGGTPDHQPNIAPADVTKVNLGKIGLQKTETASQFGKKVGLNLDGEDELDSDSQGVTITKTVPKVIIGKKI